jgi:hypothetical protein
MKFITLLTSVFFLCAFSQPGERRAISYGKFVDKIRGGWAGQYFGASLIIAQPVFASTDSLSISNPITSYIQHLGPSDESVVANIYSDLLYLALIDEHGDKIEVPLSQRLQSSDFLAGHAMQTAGYNLRNGMETTSSGRWTNNPHAEDSDFAKAADVLGLLTPGMPRTLLKTTDPIGHITNTGEGYYGGIYVAALNSLAFISKNPVEIVNHALRSLPEKSDYRKCLEDVAFQTKQHPNEWMKNWIYLSSEWRKHTGCPFNPSSLTSDARIYTAFATLIFLAGEGDLAKTMTVANTFPGGREVLPTVLGLLGVMNGLESFPSDWQLRFDSVAEVRLHESLPTLGEACDLSVKNALKIIEANGGRRKADGDVVIRLQHPSSHRLERGFEGHYIAGVQFFNTQVDDQFEFEFEGVGFVLHADQSSSGEADEITFAELYLNNKYIDRIAIPGNKSQSASDLCWKLQLPHKKYRGRLKLLRSKKAPSLTVTKLVVYDVMPLISER